MTEACSYYGTEAYRSDSFPDQPVQKQDFNHSKLRRSAGYRLPWGGTKHVIPPIVMERTPPKALRYIEKNGDLLEGKGFQGEFSHECIRFARLALRSRVVNFLEVGGKMTAVLLTPFVLITYFMFVYLLGPTETWLSVFQGFLPAIFGAIVLPAFVWLIARLSFKLFPRWFVKNGRGPEWELNRRTGMVTLWLYPRKWAFRKQGSPQIIQAPFYEFDGWVMGGADRFGTRFDFVLCHRYQKLSVHIGNDLLSWHRFPDMCYAFWDFIQNYMDVTRPLPDMPALEAYRHLDPVTAEHDRRNRRVARYWRDMDDRSFDQKVRQMFDEVKRINPEQRPNLMAKKVRYAHMTPEDMLAYGRGSRKPRQGRSGTRITRQSVENT
ncbi:MULTISPECIES: hypothetical protein [Marinobacter]|uniref:Uncharacterized protein n=1 Tax=Marinobacter xiaoshiensis TaxID=3073652 RepID=A0ABU2HKU5_9GAMM|nr:MULTISPECIES: hypothetical protein [unclassified Marinobacter]MDS1311695.1 hypothetical protein [Marinobacter sp. F60267]